jgi:membrane fusion protein, heavy metal efflux system
VRIVTRGVLGIGGMALVIAASAACRKDATKDQPAPAPAAEPAPASKTVTIDKELVAQGRVKLGAVERRAPRGELRVAGEVRSNEAGSAEAGTLVSGRVATLDAVEGARVKKGQVLAWVDAPEVGRAAADVLRARARAGVAARRLARQVELEKQQATSGQAVDDARGEDEAARADLLAARTLLANLGGVEPAEGSHRELAIVRVPVRAPIDGVVAKRDAVLGAPVSPDKSLFRIVAGDRVAVVARVPETAQLPAAGTRATLVARGSSPASCAATSTGTLGAIDEATRTYSVRLEPDSASCTWLVPGGYVDVGFPGAAAGEAHDLVVPREAVIDVSGVPSAFVPTAREGQFAVRTLRVRAGEGPELVVESGLAEGEKIVVAGALLLKGEMLRAELGQ